MGVNQSATIIAGLLFITPDLAVRDQAKRAREEFAHALSAYLDLVALKRAADAGPAEALEKAAEVGEGWPFLYLQGTLRRARLEKIPPTLPVYARHGAADAVLALDKPSMLAGAYHLREFKPGDRFDIGPFRADTWLLPHFVPNAGIRLTTPEAVLAYTGDTGPSPKILRLAQSADLLLSEATYIHEVPTADAPYLLTARMAGQYASQAGAASLMLTHLWPGTDPKAAHETAAEAFRDPIYVATSGLVTNVARGSGHAVSRPNDADA
ncbi:MBL fold metallo-hydrolase [Streptomyces sp. NRRL S-481]|uniref:MBL fold metallo-hydrolase n=2 Tax=unclassified Streptomyces TaxID=2593676 RepID=UPI0018FFBB12|nr:MBL fold metallo-hydrolase [Streptomyces sp. NRRL S-481]